MMVRRKVQERLLAGKVEKAILRSFTKQATLGIDLKEVRL